MPPSVLERARARQRLGRLRGAQRAGDFARTRARTLRKDYLRRGWRQLTIAALGLAALGLLALLLPKDLRGFASGAWLAGWAAVFWHWIDVSSGAANVAMGDHGEQWTLDEIRGLHRQGWRIVNALRLDEGGDIDTLLTGGPGLVVLETKWSASGWTDYVRRNAIEGAIRQVRSRQRALRSRVADIGPIPVYAGVVLWPAWDAPARHSRGSVEVMRGTEVRAWIEGLSPAPGLSEDALWSFVAEDLLVRDAELRVDDPLPESLQARLLQFGQYPVGIYLAALFVALTASFGGLGLALALSSLGIVGGAALSRTDLLRGLGLSFALTTAGATLAALALELHSRLVT